MMHWLVKPRRAQILLLIAAVLLLDWLFLSLTRSLGFARPLVMLLFVLCSLAAILDLRAAVAILLLVASTDGFIKGWLGSSTLSLLLKDYFLGLAAICWLSGAPWRTRESSWHHSIRLPMILLALCVLAQIANPLSGNRYIASLAGARAWLVWLGVFFVAHDLLTNRKMAELLVRWILLLAVLCAGYAMLQQIYGFGFLGEASPQALSRAETFQWLSPAGQRLARVHGTTVHPGALGTFMGQAILLGLGSFLASQRRSQRLFCAGCAAIATVGLLLSGARTAMAAAAVGWLSMLLVWRSARLPLLVAAVLLPGILVAGSLTRRSAYERGLDIWTRRVYTFERGWGPMQWAFDMALQHPLGRGIDAGVGVPDVLQDKVKTSGLFYENDYARALVELGFPGLFIFGWLLWWCLRYGWRSCEAIRGQPSFALGMSFLGCIVMTEVSLFTGSTLYLAPGALIFWTCVAGASALAGHPQTERPAPTRPAPTTGKGPSPQSA